MNNKKIAQELLVLAKDLVGLRIKPERRNYIPKDAVPFKDVGGTDAEIWTYEFQKRDGSIGLYAIAFAGNANKPLWNYSFRDENQRKRQIKDTIDMRKKYLEEKEKKQKERIEFKHSYKEGDILYSSWGYDQTNVNWYKVVGVLEKSVKLREVGSKSVGSDKVVPLPNRFVDSKVLLRRVSTRDSVRIDSVALASRWDGRPKYETPFNMGH